MFNIQSTQSMYNFFTEPKRLYPNFFLKTPFQHAFNSSICLHLRVRAGVAYIRTDKLYDSCKVNRAISSTPLLCETALLLMTS